MWVGLRSLLFASLLVPFQAGALDLGPLDGIPPPPGVTAISLEYADQTSSGSFATSLGSFSGTIDRQAWKLRVGHGFTLGSMPAYTYGEVAWRDSAVSGSDAELLGIEGDDGIGDLALATAIWPYANREAGRFWGVAGYIVAPTGDYITEKNLEGVNFNAGSNRWIGVLQTGIHQRLGERWHWSIGSDVTVFEDNDQVSRIGSAVAVEQEVKPYITYQTSIAWRAHRALVLAASYYVDRGAETRLNGGDWGSATNRERYGLWALTGLSEKTRLAISYKSTVDDSDDFELKDNIQLRIIRIF